jgi:hypothetical protein
MSLIKRKLTGKTAWRTLTARVVRAEAFAWIDAVTLLYKSGHFRTRQEAVDLLFSRVNAEDLKEYRRATARAV